MDSDAAQMAAFPSRSENAFMTHWTMRVLVNKDTCVRTILCDNHIAGYVVSWCAENIRLVGYWIGKTFWGRGIATQALMSFLQIDVHRPIYAHVASHNIGSIRVLEKCGFKAIGEDIVLLDNASHVITEITMRLDIGAEQGGE